MTTVIFKYLVQGFREFPSAIHIKFPPQPGNENKAVP